jgi:hypothetical protein
MIEDRFPPLPREINSYHRRLRLSSQLRPSRTITNYRCQIPDSGTHVESVIWNLASAKLASARFAVGGRFYVGE